MEYLRNGHNTAIRSAISPSRMCGSLRYSVHGCPRWVAPIKHHPEIRTNEGIEPVLSESDDIPPQFLVM